MDKFRYALMGLALGIMADCILCVFVMVFMIYGVPSSADVVLYEIIIFVPIFFACMGLIYGARKERKEQNIENANNIKQGTEQNIGHN